MPAYWQGAILMGGVSMAKKPSDTPFTTTTVANIPDLGVDLLPNTDYFIDGLIIWQSAALTTGIRWSFTGPTGVVEFTAVVETQLTASTWNVQTHTAYGQGVATTGTDVINTRRLARIRGVVRNGPTMGQLFLQAASEVAATGVTVRAGSFLRVV